VYIILNIDIWRINKMKNRIMYGIVIAAALTCANTTNAFPFGSKVSAEMALQNRDIFGKNYVEDLNYFATLVKQLQEKMEALLKIIAATNKDYEIADKTDIKKTNDLIKDIKALFDILDFAKTSKKESFEKAIDKFGRRIVSAPEDLDSILTQIGKCFENAREVKKSVPNSESRDYPALISSLSPKPQNDTNSRFDFGKVRNSSINKAKKSVESARLNLEKGIKDLEKAENALQGSFDGIRKTFEVFEEKVRELFSGTDTGERDIEKDETMQKINGKVDKSNDKNIKSMKDLLDCMIKIRKSVSKIKEIISKKDETAA
jgi:hypothetical protein